MKIRLIIPIITMFQLLSADNLVIDGDLTVEGDMGIGIDPPNAKLQIDQDEPKVALRVLGGNSGKPLAVFERDIGSDGGVSIRNAGSDLFINYYPDFDGIGTSWYTGIADSFGDSFRIGHSGRPGTGSTVLSLLPSGDVGIGTDNPQRETHVYNDSGNAIIRLENEGFGNRSGIEFFRQRSSTQMGYGAGAIWVDSADNLNGTLILQANTSMGVGSHKNGAFKRLSLDSSFGFLFEGGNVGIGQPLTRSSM